MQMLNIDTGMIPVYPGQFSAFGFTCSDVRIDRQRTLQMRSDKMDYGRINAVADTLRTATLDDLGEQGATKDCSLVFSVDVRYDGQNYELSVPVQFDEFTPEAIAMLRTDFDALFLERYGFNQVGEVIEFVNLNLAAVVLQDKPQIQNNQSAETVAKPTSTRKVWFADGWIKTPVYMRSDVGVGITIPGPAIIEEDVSVLPVNPGQTVTANATGVLILETQGRKT